MFALAAFVMVIYDFLLTLGDEVDIIWKREGFSVVTCLWCVNRYLTPLSYAVIIVAFHDPRWSDTDCERWIRYPQILRLVIFLSLGGYFVLRLYALWGRHKNVLWLSCMLMIAFTGVKIWAILDMEALKVGYEGPQYVGCFVATRHPPYVRYVYTYVSEVVFDIVIMAATIYRCYTFRGLNSPLLSILKRESFLYLLIIMIVSLTNVLMFCLAPPNMKNLVTSFSGL
ncbi:hypothetical protein Moror_7084 [Moniliophthora roreri MCA 2997]|uniref:DUF6533 domain-containing protein n=2 Tax=Moniliophthora roreri TaxID=221103 RepID=V2XAT7_MONRO|nr:hypothetical protein Moror_7084 [Moniliophthora roreri MCA 2997]